MVIRSAALLMFLLAAACGDSDGTAGADAGSVDAGAATDAAASADAGPEFPRPGFGDIAGACDELDDELTSDEPALIVSSFDFAQNFTEDDSGILSAGGQEILADGTAGGSSVLSEVFAFEMLARCESAQLLKTETEIVYDTEGKLTDFLAELDGEKIGVSVTRAVGFPFDAPYEFSQAQELLQDKLSDILESSANVSEGDRWQKQILSVLAYAPGHADVLQEAWSTIDAETRADTVVHIIVTNGEDDFIYCNGACPQ